MSRFSNIVSYVELTPPYVSVLCEELNQLSMQQLSCKHWVTTGTLTFAAIVELSVCDWTNAHAFCLVITNIY